MARVGMRELHLLSPTVERRADTADTRRPVHLFETMPAIEQSRGANQLDRIRHATLLIARIRDSQYTFFSSVSYRGLLGPVQQLFFIL